MSRQRTPRREDGESRSGIERAAGRAVRARMAAFAAPALLLVAATAMGCATAGVSLSDTSFDRDQLREYRRSFSTVYELLQAHGRVSFVKPDRGGGDEVMLVYERGRGSISAPGTLEGALYVDNRRVPDPIPYLRDLRLSEVETLRILRATETSARHGGDGRRGAVSITTRGS